MLAVALAAGLLRAVPAAADESVPAVPGPAAAGDPAPASPGPAAAGEPAPANPEPLAGATVGEVRILNENIFDLSDPKEDNWIFRLANKLHIRTRPWVVSHQLLFRPGDPYNPRLLAESERNLRTNSYFYDARIQPGAVHDGRVDVDVRTRDVWTLQPGVSFQRSGGKNTTGVDLKEKNLLGLGSSLSIASKSTPDRRENSVNFSDDHVAGTRVGTSVTLSSNSDGHRQSYMVQRPFYALDARWAASALYENDLQIDTLVGAGSVAGRFQTRKKKVDLWGGWSRGLINGWTWRFLAGGTRDESRFTVVSGDNAVLPVPKDRILEYPYLGFELVQDDYQKVKNRDQIERTEDFYLGLRVRATAGYAFPAIGSDRYAMPFSASFGKGGQFGERWTVISEGMTTGRVEGGSAVDTKLSGSGRVYLAWSERWLSFASIAGNRLVTPDQDHQLDLGGDTGLRGYPARYQSGDRSYLATIEQRFFSTWYPFRLFRPGAAAFFDIGRAWGGNVTGLPATGRLRDAGVGLRIGVTRSGLGNVIHVDVAFPLDGDPSIAKAQVLVTTKSSF